MSQIFVSGLFAFGLFIGFVGCSHYGWRLGRRRLKTLGENGHAGLGAVDAAVYGLMGLLVAFTFTGAAARFDQRRDLIVAEVNAIGTAWLRLDLLEEKTREEVRNEFRLYVDRNLDIARNASMRSEIDEGLAKLAENQRSIWSHVNGAIEESPEKPIAQVLFPALNEMFDSNLRRVLATKQHPPFAVYVMLVVTVLASAVFSGFGMAKARQQSWLHLIGFSAVLALSIYLILDLEYPRLGLVRVTDFDQAMVELRQSMGDGTATE